MSISLLTSPIKTDIAGSGIRGDANAALTQLAYTFKREDFTSTFLSDGGDGDIQIVLDQLGVADQFIVGESLYYGGSDRMEAGEYTVKSSIEAASTRVAVFKQGISQGTTTPAFINTTSRQNYKINIDVLDIDYELIVPVTLNYAPKTDGNLFVDLGPLLVSYMDSNGLDSLLYRIRYFESWEGSDVYLVDPVYPFSASVAGQGRLTVIASDTYDIGPDVIGRNCLFIGAPVNEYIKVNTTSYPDLNTRVGFDYPETVVSPGTFQRVYEATVYNNGPVQAVLSKLDRRNGYGANMFDYLLRAGGGVGVNWDYYQPDPNFPASGNIPGDSCTGTWGDYNNAPNCRLSGPGTTCTKILNDGNFGTTNEGLILAGSFVHFYAEMALQSSAFIAAGDIRLDVLGIRADGTRAQLIVQTVENITGNFGFSNKTYDYVSFVTVEDFVGIGYNFFKINGDFDIDIWLGRNDQLGFVRLWTDYEPAKFLTRFANPLIWPGWKRTASYLMDPQFTARTGYPSTRFNSVACDINKGGLFGVNKLTNGDVTPRIITETIDIAGVPNEAFIRCRVFENLLEFPFLDQKFYQITCVPNSPLCLTWRNSLGGFDQWVFGTALIYRNKSDLGTVTNSPVDVDLYEGQTTTRTRTDIDKRQSIILRAENLTGDQLAALDEIKSSDFVGVYLTKDGSEIVEVVTTESLTTELETGTGPYKITIVVEFPDNVYFQNARKY